MKVKISNNGVYQQYTCSNERGQSLALSGTKEAVSPMESILMAAAGCSAVDVEIILEKMKQPLQSLEVVVDGERAEDEIPKVFTKIHLHYILKGNIKEEKAASAVQMSVEKYCSVLTMLMCSVEVAHSYKIELP